jgi:hypothetical protein
VGSGLLIFYGYTPIGFIGTDKAESEAPHASHVLGSVPATVAGQIVLEFHVE